MPSRWIVAHCVVVFVQFVEPLSVVARSKRYLRSGESKTAGRVLRGLRQDVARFGQPYTLPILGSPNVVLIVL
jgi:hypothetical protein